MIVCLIVFLFGFTWIQVNAYVLLQIQKGQNASKVDALIHKVVPNVPSGRKSGVPNEKELGSVIFAIDDQQPHMLEISKIDGASPISELSLTPIDNANDLQINDTKHENRKFGSGRPFKPSNMKIVHFRSGKPSLKVDVSANNVVDAINGLMANKDVRSYIDEFSHKFVNVYKSIQDELMRNDE